MFSWAEILPIPYELREDNTDKEGRKGRTTQVAGTESLRACVYGTEIKLNGDGLGWLRTRTGSYQAEDNTPALAIQTTAAYIVHVCTSRTCTADVASYTRTLVVHFIIYTCDR